MVGEYAKQLFSDGVEIKAEYFETDKLLKDSQEALKLRKPLFEAGFKYKNAFARVDILNPVGSDAWEIIEVKSSTEVKEINLHDLAIQWHVYEGAGLNIRSCSICHINNQYVRKGEIEPQKLFTIEDVTTEVKKLLPDVKKNLKQMQEAISLSQYPEIKIGPHCDDPYTCSLKEKCWSFLPIHNVFTLTRIGKKGFELLADGIFEIQNIPRSYQLSDRQAIQAEAVRSRKPYINKQEIRDFLNTLEYPLYFLDFETFMTAIPMYENVRPYQSIIFQYSLHVLNSAGVEPKHYSFLADGKQDPRPEILKLLKELLGKKGSIIAYNAGFEKGKLADACATFTVYEGWFEGIQSRFVDLLSPFRSFDYYHPEQNGSASIKAVLPVLTGKSYEGMEIADGGTASNEYLRVTFGDVDTLDRQHVRDQLKKILRA